MFASAHIKIKICCIASVEEARLAVQLGAAAIGLVAQMPSGPGPIENHLIKTIAASVPPPIATFLLTSETMADAIIRHHDHTHTNTIQLVDALQERKYSELKTNLPAVKIVQVIHVTGDESVDEALEVAEYADALLLDSGNPRLAVKELGGTGRVHNWQLSRRIVQLSKVPVFLAGGLHAGNIREAIDTVQPFAVDVCSGVRTDGKLDPYKLETFVKAVL